MRNEHFCVKSALLKASLAWLLLVCGCVPGLAQERLPHTEPLTIQGDVSARMVAGIDQFLTRETQEADRRARTILAPRFLLHRRL